MNYHNNLPTGVTERDCDGPPLSLCDHCGRRHHNYNQDQCATCIRDHEERDREDMFLDQQPRDNDLDRKPIAATAILLVTTTIIFWVGLYYTATTIVRWIGWLFSGAAMWIGSLSFLSMMGGDLKLAWDPSPDGGVTNYVIYAHTNSFPKTNRLSAVARLNVGTNLTASIESLSPGVWTFAATAMIDGVESEISNIVHVQVPRKPETMRTVVIQYGGTLTNFYDVGFFRLRLNE